MIRIHIRKNERGLLLRDGDFRRLLRPGTYRLWSRLLYPKRTRVEIVDAQAIRFEHPMLEILLREPQLRGALTVVELTDTQRALVWKDGRLLSIAGPGKHAFWNDVAELNVEVFDIGAFRFEHPKLATVLTHPHAGAFFDGVRVNQHEEVLLMRDGVLIDRLGEGLHVFWRGTGAVTWKAIDRREQVADVAGQEIMTSDKVTLRVNLVVTYVVADALRSVTATADAHQALYREAQLVLRAAVGTRTLDALLGDKEAVGSEVRKALLPRAEAIGLSVKSVGLRDIVLPGDMKTLLNQVIAATKEAEANLIRRREETAAARSQANTAKLLAENPLLARLKELEVLKEVLAGTSATFVLGAGDITDQVRSLVSARKSG